MTSSGPEIGSDQIRIRTPLVFISIGTLVGMAVYETVKEVFFPLLSKWESHLITIIVTVLLVTVLTGYILNKQNSLIIQMNDAKRETDSVQKHLASIVRFSDDAILSIDTNGIIISFNPAAVRIFGKTAEMMIQHPLSELFPPEIPDRTRDLIDRVWYGQTILRDEGVFLHDNGARIHLSVTAAPLPGSVSGTGSISLIARDISDQKAREEMLKMLNLKQQLLTSITRHDIKNNLHILMGYCSILEEKISDPDITRLVSVISGQSEKINDELIFMETYESLGSPPVWQRAEEVFHRAVDPLESGRVEFTVSLAGLEVYTDPLIEKVVYNLCDNALRYGRTLSYIRTGYIREDETCIWFIEDDGVGVQEELKEKIFENGFGQTTGLGLYLARQILSITGIGIRETGTPSQGARFEMILPPGIWRVSVRSY